eukprot:3821745-Pyramimonas_sp.AAC.1
MSGNTHDASFALNADRGGLGSSHKSEGTLKASITKSGRTRAMRTQLAAYQDKVPGELDVVLWHDGCHAHHQLSLVGDGHREELLLGLF